MPHGSDWWALIDALDTYLTGHASVVGLGLVYLGPSPQLAPEPVYPSSPVADCPRLHIRAYRQRMTPMPSLRTDMAQQVSLWYYRRQTPGQNHAQLLQQDLDTLSSVFTGEWDPAGLDAATEAFYGAFVEEVVVHDELRHELDDPRLRVSVGEIVLRLDSSSRG